MAILRRLATTLECLAEPSVSLRTLWLLIRLQQAKAGQMNNHKPGEMPAMREPGLWLARKFNGAITAPTKSFKRMAESSFV